jgi:hypothetical protein
MKLADALTQVRDEDSKLTERELAWGQLTAEADGIYAAGERLNFCDQAFEQLCDRFQHGAGVPARYLRSLPPEMSTPLLRHHLNEGIEGGDSIALYLRGQQITGIGRPDLVLLTGSDLMEAVLDGVGGREDDLEVSGLTFVDDSVRFELVTQRAQTEVRRGDPVYAGVSVAHSLTGEFATRVEGYVLRLRCLNGAVSRECVKPRHVHRSRRLSASRPGARDQQRKQISALAKDAMDRLNQRMVGLRRLTTERADLEHLGPNWLRRLRLSSDRLMPLLRQAHAIEGSENTAYGILNAITRVATHNTELPPNIRSTLARMGGLLAFGHSRLCSKCWSLVAESN